MSIKSFLEEVRFNTYTTDIDIPYDRTEQPYSFLVCQLRRAVEVAQGLQESTEYSLDSYLDVRKDVGEIFRKIEDKIEKLSRLAEGYQYLNTNELDNDTIHDLQVFELTDKVGYNDITKSLTLPRLNKARELRPTTVKKENIGGEELYKLKEYRDSVLGITVIDGNNTQIVKAELLDEKKELISVVLPVNGRILHKLPEETRYVLVHTNNADKLKSYYTTLSVLENRYEERSTLTLGEGTFKAGKLFKLFLDTRVPTEAQLKVEVKFTHGTEVSTWDGSTSTGKVKHLGNKVFDVSGIGEFYVIVKVTLESTTDTPEIRGAFAYVTEK